MKKSKIRNIALLSIGILTVAGWLFFSNSIIARIINKETVEEADFDTVRNTYLGDYVHCVFMSSVDFITYEGGMFDKLSVSGWAFCETEEDNKDRYTVLLLKGKDRCYELKPFRKSRPDVPINVPKDLNRDDMKISSNTGYIGQFSLLDVKNGTYDIYLCTWENETNHGMRDTLYQMVRDGSETSIIPWSASSIEDNIEVSQSTQTIGYLDSARLDDDRITVSGWEFVKDEDSGRQNVYIGITGSDGNSVLYPTKSSTREDVADDYGDQKYAQSGYVTTFPKEDIKDGLYSVRTFVENNGEIWGSKQYSMYKNGDVISVFQSAIRLVSPLESNLAVTEDNESQGDIDSVELKGGLVTFTGWEFAPDRESSESSIVIELTNSDGKITQYPTIAVNNTDVSKIYNDERYAHSGYTMSINAEEVPDGTYTVKVLIENGGDVWQSRWYTLERDGQTIIIGLTI